VSEPYDLFVNCTHWRPPFSHARRAVLLVLFPFYTPPWHERGTAALPWWRQLRHETYYSFEWRRRLGTYDRTLAISRYSADWTRRRWRVGPEIVHPPVDVAFERVPKDNLIVSVGRYSTMAHTKKQAEMVRTFAAMHADGMRGWQYACVGGLNTRAENHAYFERVRADGAAAPVVVEANVPRARVRDLLSRGRIFWHATGLGEDEDTRPELAEHFGIATVEAMAAGCVPVVINRGGQSEIVTHGRNGFLWNTLDEMKAYTCQLAEDPALWAQLSDAARRRASDFTRTRFLERMSAASGLDAPVGAETSAYLGAGR
jgi:glycosyltransferase involved in cell wall biosynthesis